MFRSTRRMTAPFGSRTQIHARFVAGALGALAIFPALDLRAETVNSTTTAATPTERFGVELTLERSPLERKAILSALEKELSVPVEEVQSGPGLRLVIVGNRLEASHRDATGRVVGRALTLPEPPAQQIEMIALLAGNLARDEAGDVLARLRGTAAPATTTAGSDASTAEQPKSPDSTASEAPVDAKPPTSPAASPAAAKPSASVKAQEPAKSSEPDAPVDAKPGAVERKGMPASLTLFSPISTDPSLSEHEAHFDIGAFYSHMGALDGFAVNGAVARSSDGGRGIQVAGLALMDDGPFRGVKVAGIFESGDGVDGAAVAGILSIERGRVEGAQVSLINLAGPSTTSTNSASGATTAAEKATDFSGFQAGLFNSISGASTGAQIGLINVGGAHNGAQIGLVNIQSGTARGAQIGLVNVADDMKGAPLGLVNVIPTLRTQALAWASITPTADGPARAVGPMAHVGVKYLLGHFYTQISFGVGVESNYCNATSTRCFNGDSVFAPGFGVGGRIDFTESFALELDGVHQTEFSPSGDLGLRNSLAARASAVWQLNEWLAVFGGGGPRVDVSPGDIENERWNPTFHAGIQLF